MSRPAWVRRLLGVRSRGTGHRDGLTGQAIVLAATLLAPGCGAADRGADGRTAGAPGGSGSFAEQIAAVRQGHSDRIDVAAAPAAADWHALRGLAGLRVLVLREGIATDAEAEILTTLPDLERLVLRESPLSDDGLRSLGRCRQLRDLNVPHAAGTAAGIESLASLPRLRSLRLGGPTLGGPAAARAVAALPGLRSLHLIDVAIGDEGLAALAELSALENLYLDGAGVSAEAWEGYFQRRPHVHVHVDQAHHDRDPRRGHD